ncbi:SDR family oxidoreductase [Deinococcus sonorensis]|uniref:SDR family oxidoreductase n=2 Tax=Deinococcus sonorensis TaxID=309891 RepID=A0AAU7UC71_9DEIO
MARYLVTGGAGFIGSHLVEALVNRGDDVVVFDDLSSGRYENIAHLEGRFRFVRDDLRTLPAVEAAMEGVDFVSHLGALGSVPRSIADPITSHNVNATGTLNVLLAAKQARVKRVVYASSSSVYGDNVALPTVETMPLRPISPYALTKLTGEEYCRIFSLVYGLETVTLRFFNVFGPRQWPNSPYAAVIPKFINAMLEGRAPIINGDGLQSRDFTFVLNNIDANLKALEMPAQQVVGRSFNIACGDQISLVDIVSGLNQILGTNIAPEFGPTRPGDIKHSCANIVAAAQLLNYRPLVRFWEGLEQTVDHYRQLMDTPNIL